jgi:hypothetical protein
MENTCHVLWRMRVYWFVTYKLTSFYCWELTSGMSLSSRCLAMDLHITIIFIYLLSPLVSGPVAISHSTIVGQLNMKFVHDYWRILFDLILKMEAERNLRNNTINISIVQSYKRRFIVKNLHILRHLFKSIYWNGICSIMWTTQNTECISAKVYLL